MKNADSQMGRNAADPENTYFLSFMLNNAKNKTEKRDTIPRQRMVVNNNFSGDKMGTSQYYMENGTPSAKGPPAHNIQLLSNNAGNYHRRGGQISGK